jgi:hypothetical protein
MTWHQNAASGRTKQKTWHFIGTLKDDFDDF